MSIKHIHSDKKRSFIEVRLQIVHSSICSRQRNCRRRTVPVTASHYQLQSLTRLGEIKLVNFGPLTEKFWTLVLIHPSGLFGKLFPPLGVLASQTFTRAIVFQNLLAKPHVGTGSPKNFKGEH